MKDMTLYPGTVLGSPKIGKFIVTEMRGGRNKKTG